MIPKFVEILGKNGQPMAVPMTVNRNDGTSYVPAEVVTRGSSASDSLAHTATLIHGDIVDEDEVLYLQDVDFELDSGAVKWLTMTTTAEVVTKGADDGTDALDNLALTLTTVNQGATVYVDGVDYQLTAGGVEWLGGAGDQPVTATEYTVTYTHYVKAPAETKDYTVAYQWASTGSSIILPAIVDAAYYLWSISAYCKTTGTPVVTATDGETTFDFRLNANSGMLDLNQPIQFGTGRAVVIYVPDTAGGTVLNTLTAIASGKGG